MINKTLTAVALAAVLATPAFAQTNTAPKPDAAPMAQPNAAKPDMNKDMNKSDAMKSTAQPNTNAQNTGTAATTATAEKKEAGFVQNQAATEWRASQLIGASVYGPDNASIGEINELVLLPEGGVKAVVVGVGGFLGIGQKDVAIPFESLNVQRKADSASIDKITVSFTKDELKNAPKFAYYEAPKSTTTGSRPGAAPMTPSRPAPAAPAGTAR